VPRKLGACSRNSDMMLWVEIISCVLYSSLTV
jgi:hypothetical protein